MIVVFCLFIILFIFQKNFSCSLQCTIILIYNLKLEQVIWSRLDIKCNLLTHMLGSVRHSFSNYGCAWNGNLRAQSQLSFLPCLICSVCFFSGRYFPQRAYNSYHCPLQTSNFSISIIAAVVLGWTSLRLIGQSVPWSHQFCKENEITHSEHMNSDRERGVPQRKVRMLHCLSPPPKKRRGGGGTSLSKNKQELLSLMLLEVKYISQGTLLICCKRWSQT